MKYDRQVFIKPKTYSILELITGTGGLVVILYVFLTPIPRAFSRLNFELGVMSLLYHAKKTIRTTNQPIAL